MRRLAVLALGMLAIATAGACGSSAGGSSTPPPSASALVSQAGTALGKAKSVAFQLTIHASLQGHLSGGGSSGALLGSGPLTLSVRGQAATSGRFDATVALNAGGLSLSGRLLSADGHVGYVQAPAIFGPGWHSFPIPATTGATTGAGFGGSDPARWLAGVSVASASGSDTLSGRLNLKALIAALSQPASTTPGAIAPQALAQYVRAIKQAGGSVTFDHTSHLPSRATGNLRIVLPPSLAAGAGGLRGVTLAITITFPSWNRDFRVTVPSGATPVSPKMLSGVLGA